ncbi:hypothetical protein ONK27_25990, partial [Salmonella enterica subsp. enterica serovar Virginia]|nr:hypothetical protein [Salmonella enterica subsp. enterica serovar Virginia]
TLAMGHDEAVKAYEQNISALAIAAQFISGDGAGWVKVVSVILCYGTRTPYTGSEVFLSLVDQHEAPYPENLRHITVTAMVTNRDL